jgi:hypothetical protein
LTENSAGVEQIEALALHVSIAVRVACKISAVVRRA